MREVFRQTRVELSLCAALIATMIGMALLSDVIPRNVLRPLTLVIAALAAILITAMMVRLTGHVLRAIRTRREALR